MKTPWWRLWLALLFGMAVAFAMWYSGRRLGLEDGRSEERKEWLDSIARGQRRLNEMRQCAKSTGRIEVVRGQGQTLVVDLDASQVVEWRPWSARQ